MKHIPYEMKEMLVQKVLSQPGSSITEIAKEHHVGRSTLSRWVNEFRTGTLKPKESVTQARPPLTKAEQLQHILATATLDAQALGVYCRERGLYAVQLEAWKNELMKTDEDKQQQKLLAELKLLRSENKQLKKDIRRKDRALAETTALLVLKKKADALWGVDEDE